MDQNSKGSGLRFSAGPANQQGVFDMDRFRWMTAATLALAIGVGTAAFAQGPRAGGPGRGGPGRVGVMPGLPLASLNLTQAQQDLIRDIRARNRTEAQQGEEKLRQARLAQQKAINAIPINEGAIRAATLALAEIETEMAVLRARAQNEIFAALTADQQAQVKQALAEREQRAQQRPVQRDERRQNRQ
jgi:Spy/CpxP family protein refolding chaperone